MARGQRDLGLERQWRDRMSQWRASGLSVREFCQWRGMTEPTFHDWSRELRMLDSAASTAAMSSSSGKKSRPVFVQLMVLSTATLAVEVRCPSGHVGPGRPPISVPGVMRVGVVGFGRSPRGRWRAGAEKRAEAQPRHAS